jgi:hypothetical protein
VALDVARNGLRVSFGLLGLTIVVGVIPSQTLQSHMRPPGIVRVFEFHTQGCEVIESLCDRHVSQPLILERLDDTFCNRDGPLFPTAPKQGLMFYCLSSSAKASPVKTLACSETMCLEAPHFRIACSKASMIRPALGPSRGVTQTTLRAKWSMATRTGQRRGCFATGANWRCDRASHLRPLALNQAKPSR